MKTKLNRIIGISLWLLIGAMVSCPMVVAGGIDVIWVEDGWNISTVPLSVDTNYVAITGDGLTPLQNLYAARADGGIDEFYVDNAGWHKATLSPGGNPLTTSYVDLAADASAAQMIYALRKDNPPTVDIKSPASGATIWPPSKVTVTVVVVDDEDVNTVSLSATVDGNSAEIEEELVNDDGSIDLVVHLPKEARGTYTDGRNLLVKITATDSSGQTGSDDVNIFVPHDMRNKMGNYPK